MSDTAETFRPDGKAVRTPGPDHPITVTPHAGRVTVKLAGQVIADTEAALVLQEANYPGVLYIPRGDLDLSLVTRSDHTTYCPYKGDCSYFSIPSGGDRSLNAIWTYEAPYDAVAQIKDYVAFYPSRVDEIVQA